MLHVTRGQLGWLKMTTVCVCVCVWVYSEHLGTLAALSMSRPEGLLCNSSNS